MNWYLKTILIAGGVENYLQSLGATPEIIQFIVSQGANSQMLVNEFRQNPAMTIEQLQQIQMPQQQQVDPYTDHEKQVSKRYPNVFSKWILTNLRKIRMSKETAPEEQKAMIHSFYMNFIDSLSEITDWALRSQPAPDISSHTAEQAMEASEEWHRAMASQGEGVEYEPTQPDMIVYGPQWQNPEWQGWTIQKVAGENDLEVEGNRMDHCVGGFCEDVERENSIIFSLRDPQNQPHATMEFGGNQDSNPGTIKQIQGKSNSEPKGEYKSMIKEWISVSGKDSGINTEINAWEQMENDYDYQYNGPTVENLTDVIGKILQGESNEYGLKYIFDADMDTIIDDLVGVGESESDRFRNQDGQYFGDITNAPDPVANLALMQDLKLPQFPRNQGEWKELKAMPKQSEWKNIQETEKWAWEAIDELTENFDSYDMGLEYPQEENYEVPEEFEQAMTEYDDAEMETHNEWLISSVKGGFAKDLLHEIKSFRESGLVPSAEELYAMKEQKKKQELETTMHGPAYQDAYQRGQEIASQAISKGNWYKKAQYKTTDFEDMFGDDFFGRKNIQRNVVNEEEKTDNKTINLYRNFDANMDHVDKDQNGNLIFSPKKCEQGVLWFAHDLQSSPEQYYNRGEKYLLTYPLNIQSHYIERTYDNGDVIKEPISDSNEGFEDGSKWAGYELPEGFKFSYKTEKHIICEKQLIAPPGYVKEINDELV